MKRFPIFLTLVCLGLTALLLVPGIASGGDDAAQPKPAADPLPPLSTDEEVEAALAEFKIAFKAKGLRGDDRSAQRDFAMEQLSAFQHKDVVDAIAKNMRHADEYVRLAAVTHLGTQRGLPAYAGKKVAAAAKKLRKDIFFLISAFDSIGKLKYLGAMDLIAKGLRHQDFGVKKAAIATIGNIGDYRLLYAMLKEVGIDAERAAQAPADGGGQPEQVGEGYSWEGAEAEVDTGTSGDGDQKAAEKAAKEKAAANEAAAKNKAGANGGAPGGFGGNPGATGGGGGGGRGAGGRSKQELIYPIKATLSKLTGEDFKDAKGIFTWLRNKGDYVKTKSTEVSVAEKAQKDADKKK